MTVPIIPNVSTGNVNLLTFENLWTAYEDSGQAREIPGFGTTQYLYNPGDNTFYRQTMSNLTSSSTEIARTPLSLSTNLYEMFAFAASSVVAPVGATDWHLLSGAFTSGQNLALLVPQSFSNLSTGHSGEFVHSYAGVKAYWAKVMGDIQ